MASKISEFRQEQQATTPQDSYHENPLLKLAKTTKKEKQQTKSANFTNKLLNKVTFNISSGISKSSNRRRKRKEKEQLKPKMDDLLSSLQETITTTTTTDDSNKNNKTTNVFTSKEYIKSSKGNLNKPNPIKSTGYMTIMKQEHENFNNVLKSSEFRASPFDALRNAIQQNMK